MTREYTEEERKAIGERLKLSRAKKKEEAAKNPAAPKTDIVITEPATNGHQHALDIRDPSKWQMKIRLYIESLDHRSFDEWYEGLSLIHTVAGRLGRDLQQKGFSKRCEVCGKQLRPEVVGGSATYVLFDNTRVHIYCCSQHEYGKLLEIAGKRDQDRLAVEERANKAAQQAAKDARSKIMVSAQ